MKVKLLHIVLIICLTSAVYFSSMQVPFLFDDIYTITKNPSIRSLNLISHGVDLLNTDFFARPLLYLTLKINYYFGGINTFGYHLFNLILHIGVSILIYIFVSALIRKSYSTEYKYLPLFSSIIFAVHPINTEAVTYIISRSILLSTLFGLLMLLCFIKGMGYLTRQDVKRLLLFSVFYLLSSAFCLLLALASREDAAVFPIISIIYYYFFLKPKDSTIISKKNIAILAIILLVASAYPLVRFINKGSIGTSEAIGIFTPWTYLITEINVIAYYYIQLIVFPFNLNIDPDIRVISAIDMNTLFAISFILFMFFIVCRSKIMSFSLLWFFIALAPTSSVIPLLDAAAEHRVYLAMVGGAVFLASCLCKAVKHTPPKFTFILICAVFISFSVVTMKKNYVWRSAVSIWEDAARKSPFKARVYNALGLAYQSEKGDSEKALEHYNKAIAIQPLYADARINKGVTLTKQGRLGNALSEFSIAIGLKPDSPEIHNNIGIIYYKKGDLNRAVEEFQLALKINPNYEEARKNIQMVLSKP